MKTTILLLVLLSLGIIFHSTATIAQIVQDTIKSQIETMDGNEYIGIIINQTPESIRLKTDRLGEINIPQSEIKRITALTATQSKGGTYWLDNPQATRYLWTPNAYSLKAGEGYYQNVWILFNQAVFGITDHFSGGVGMMPLFLFAGAPTPIWATAKISLPVAENKFNLGVGTLAGTILGVEEDVFYYDEKPEKRNIGFGVLYGIATLGSRDNNLNIGLGWGYSEGEMAKNPTLNISGMIRTGPKGYLLTENYVIGTPEETTIVISFGGRSMIKRVGLDYGLVLPFFQDSEEFIAIPWLGFTVPFDKKREVDPK